MDDAVTPAPRERGWWRLVLALAVALLLPVVPWLRPLVPVERVVVLLVPAIAACTLVGWWRGGRFGFALAWTLLAAWMVAGLVREGGSAFDRLAGGWAVLLAATFGLVSLAAGARPFLGRALASVALAQAGVLLVLALGDGTAVRLRQVVATELERRAATSLQQWDANAASPAMRRMVGEDEAMQQTERRVREFVARSPQFGLMALPALLALQSLALLGLAWALYHRLSRARLGVPLARLRDFRFNDQLVWGLVVGVTLLVLPALADLRGAGINLLVFFGALYLLRGFGVLTWFLAPRGLAMAILVLVGLLAPPLVGAAALWFGLGDTWFDWRSRPRTTP